MKRSALRLDIPRRSCAVLALALFAASLVGCAPSAPEECLKQGSLRMMEGKIPAARKLAFRAEKLAPADPTVLIFKALVCERSGERDLALDAALRAVSANPENFIARYTLGRLYAQDPARATDAFRELKQALSLKPGDTDTLIQLCNVSMTMNPAYARAFLQMLAATPVGASLPAVQNELGILCCQRRDYKGAKNAFLKAANAKNGSREPVVMLNLARFFDYHTNAATAAAKFYREFIRLSAGRADLAALRQAAAARLAAIEKRSGR